MVFLVELIVAMVAGLIIIGAAYSIFLGQERTMSKQDKIVEMQQNVRAAMDMLSREVMMAVRKVERDSVQLLTASDYG